MDLKNPETYVSIISSALLIISEILPYLPCSSNGICQTIIEIFKKKDSKILPIHEKNKLDSTTELHYEDEELNKLKKLEHDLQQVMRDLKANKTLEIDLNLKLNEIIHELKRINKS